MTETYTLIAGSQLGGGKVGGQRWWVCGVRLVNVK